MREKDRRIARLEDDRDKERERVRQLEKLLKERGGGGGDSG
jgi:hypothetical protein